MTSRLRTLPARHPYQGDGVYDLLHRDRCQVCQLGKSHGVHALPPVPEQAEHRRRAGEADE